MVGIGILHIQWLIAIPTTYHCILYNKRTKWYFNQTIVVEEIEDKNSNLEFKLISWDCNWFSCFNQSLVIRTHTRTKSTQLTLYIERYELLKIF